jgi:hypothetical protein
MAKKKEERKSSKPKKNYLDLFFHPNKFLESIENDKEYWPILRVYLIITIISFIVSLTVQTFVLNLSGTIWQVLWGLILAIIIATIWSFAISGLCYLGAKLLKSKGEYFNIFKPVTYGLVILVIYGMISTILIGFFPIDNSILMKIQEVQDVTVVNNLYKQFFSQTGVIIYLLIFLISLVHWFIFSFTGIAKFHKISKGKAVGAIIVSLIGLIIVAFLISLLSLKALGA